MAKKRRLSPNDLAGLKADFAGLKTIDDYASVRPEFAVEQILAVEAELDDLLSEEARILARLGDVRDRIADKGTELKQKMKGARQQTVAQFGDDSPEVQKVGRKRVSERSAYKKRTKE